MLEEDEAVGQALPVVCANHPEHVSNIREVNDFDTFVRDGGCSRQCTARMPCGHTCSRYVKADQKHYLLKFPTDTHVSCNIPAKQSQT